MRVVKFRGKRIVNGDWIYGDLFREIALTPTGRKRKSEYNGFLAIQTETPDGIKSYSVDQETIGQFTGLFDKHNTEIYEGDILKGIVTENTADGDRSRTIIGKVEFGDGSYIVEIWNLGWFVFAAEDVEVIGNIHDNPELLEGGKNE